MAYNQNARRDAVVELREENKKPFPLKKLQRSSRVASFRLPGGRRVNLLGMSDGPCKHTQAAHMQVGLLGTRTWKDSIRVTGKELAQMEYLVLAHRGTKRDEDGCLKKTVQLLKVSGFSKKGKLQIKLRLLPSSADFPLL